MFEVVNGECRTTLRDGTRLNMWVDNTGLHIQFFSRASDIGQDKLVSTQLSYDELVVLRSHTMCNTTETLEAIARVYRDHGGPGSFEAEETVEILEHAGLI